MSSRLSNIVINANDARLVATFWKAALGWGEVDVDEEGVCLGPADGSWPGIDVIRVTDPKVGFNRLHLDVRADGCTQAEEVERLLALGATRADVGQGPDVSWVVLADPEGNEFCVLSSREY